MKPILGFVGIGNIGEPVCRNLLDGGYELLIYDVDPEALAPLVQERLVERFGLEGRVLDVLIRTHTGSFSPSLRRTGPFRRAKGARHEDPLLRL